MDDTTNGDKEIIDDVEEINATEEDKTHKSKKNSSNIRKVAYLITGGVLLCSLGVILTNIDRAEFVKVEINENGTTSVKKSLFKDYPTKIVDLSKYSKKLTTKESDAVSKKEEYSIYCKYIGIKDNGNSLYHVGENIIEFDEEFNEVKKIDFGSVLKDDSNYTYVLPNNVYQSKDGILAQYIAINEDKPEFIVTKFDNDGNVKSKKTVSGSQIAYDDQLDEIVLFNTNDKNKIEIIKCDSNMNVLYSYETKHKENDVYDVSIALENGLTAVCLTLNHDDVKDDYISEVIMLDEKGNEISVDEIRGYARNLIIGPNSKSYVTIVRDLFTENKSEIFEIDGSKITVLGTENKIKYIESIKKVKDGYIVTSYDEYNEETKNDFHSSTLLNITKYNNSGDTMWTNNFGVLNQLGESSYEGMFNLKTCIENNEVIIKGFLTKSQESEEKEYVEKLHIKIDKNGKISSIL